MNRYKFLHYYKNKYFVSRFSKRKFALSYNYKYRCLWFRTPKVASRTINEHFLEHTPPDQYIYSSAVGYIPDDFKSWFKFAFVREPTDRLISCWKDKVLNQNFYGFDPATHEKMKELDHFLTWVESQEIDEAEEHLRSQSALLDLDNLDFLGRLENFNEDFQFVADKIGLPIERQYKKNTSGARKVTLTEEQKLRIREIYKRDYELLYPNQNSPN